MNYYQVLNINKNASTDEINRAFRSMAKKYHPDVNKEYDSKEKFLSIFKAYTVLKNAKRRSEYDETIKNEPQPDRNSAKAKAKAKEENDLTVYTGNSEGNISGNGHFALSNGWLYYNYGTGYWGPGELRKERIDGTGRQTLVKEKCLNINVVGNWIYYYNVDDKSYLYKIRTDGTGRQKLNEDSSFYIHATENWIYYINCNDKMNNIYKIRADGTGRQKLNDDQCRHLNLSGGWIYYENLKDNYNFYKMRMDGTDRQKIINDQCYGGVVVSGEWIYYSNGNQGGCLYKIRTDGTGKQK
ncbi:MAG: DUF5050 domain-containing protein, partial [Treponema sp.]|nr:DUF5050 domain-containing protein [Treponema sp.]